MCACNFFKGDHRYDTAGCRGQGNSEILEFCTGAGMHDESAGLPVSDIGKARQGKGFVLMPPPSMEPLSKISGSQGLSVSAWGTIHSLSGHDTIRIRWTGCEAFNLAGGVREGCGGV